MTCRMNQEALANYIAHAECGRVVVFDTETTGTSNCDEIVQIAAAEYVHGEKTRELNLYIVPTCEIDPRAEAVHHLSREFLEANGIAPEVALERFFDFLGDDVLLVGHNIHFDFRMLQNECRKFGYCAEPEEVSFCDTIALAKRFAPGMVNYKLGTLIDALGLDGENSHNALDDTLACGALFFDLVNRIPRAGEYVYVPIEEDAF